MCDVAAGVGATLWQINGTLYALTQLFSGAVSTYNISGRNLVIEDIMMNDVRNGSEYQCVLLRDPPDPSIMGNISSLYVAGKYISYTACRKISCTMIKNKYSIGNRD